MRLKITLSTLLFFSLTFNAFSQALWENFDDPALATYFFVNGGLNQGFSNPATAGINTSALCGEYVRSDATFDVIVMDPIGVTAVEDVNAYSNGTKTMSLKVYSPAPGITVQITLENATLAQPANYPTGRHSEYLATTTTSGEWEELTFAYSNSPDASMTGLEINRLVILFNPNSNQVATYLWDDLMGPEFDDPCAGIVPDLSILDDFECQRHITYEFSNGNLVQGFANPDMSGVNPSTTCAQFTKFLPPTNDGAFGGDFEGTFTSLDYETISIDLYATEVLDFLVILQNESEVNVIEQTFTTSGSGVWESFSADISGISPSEQIDRIVLLLNPASMTEDVILLDNIMFSNEMVVDPCEDVIPNFGIFDDFECQRNLSYDFVNGTLAQEVANPDMTGLNTSPSCGQFTKFLPPTNDGAFGGTFEGTFTSLDYDMVFVDLYSEEVLEFLVIFQDASSINQFEQTFVTSGMSTWESFSADITSISPSVEIDKIVLLLNPASDTEDTILFDNLRVDGDVGIEDAISDVNINVFPIPFGDQLEVISSEPMSKISVIDMLGNEVNTIVAQRAMNTLIETNQLASGSYILMITTESGKKIAKKVVK